MTNEETNKDLLTEDNSNDLSLSEQQEVKAKPKLTNDMIYETFGTLAGSRNDAKLYGKMIYNQLKKACRDYDLSKEGGGETVVRMLSELDGIGAKDQIEGMLAAQMIATHHATMDCFRIVAQNGQLDIINPMLCYANKLSRTFTMQMEALNRYRGKGGQKMTVEHVHINSGGQAIIGNITKNTPKVEGSEQGQK
jgi:hypothetical protein